MIFNKSDGTTSIMEKMYKYDFEIQHQEDKQCRCAIKKILHGGKIFYGKKKKTNSRKKIFSALFTNCEI